MVDDAPEVFSRIQLKVAVPLVIVKAVPEQFGKVPPIKLPVMV
jgi:hypothetical protein